MFGFSLIAHHVGHKGRLVGSSSRLALETTAHVTGATSRATSVAATTSVATDSATGFGHFTILKGGKRLCWDSGISNIFS